MKKQFLHVHNAGEGYDAPKLEIILVDIETGFASSTEELPTDPEQDPF